VRFNPPLWFILENPCSAPLGSRTTLMGFFSPTALKGNESSRPIRLTGRLSNLNQSPSWRPPAGPTLLVTAPLTGFLNLSATYSSLCRPAVFRQVALMGFALQGIVPFTKPPAARRRWTTLLPLLPPVALPQVPRLGIHWACEPPPRSVRDRTHYRLQGLRPRESQPQARVTIKNVPSSWFAPLGLYTSSWFCPSPARGAHAPQPSRFRTRHSVTRPASSYVPRLNDRVRAANLSQDQPAIPRFLAFA
jgi:hypothetical protein